MGFSSHPLRRLKGLEAGRTGGVARGGRLERRLAERVGFEPTLGYPKPVFKTGAINHSTTSPDATRWRWRGMEADGAGFKKNPAGLSEIGVRRWASGGERPGGGELPEAAAEADGFAAFDGADGAGAVRGEGGAVEAEAGAAGEVEVLFREAGVPGVLVADGNGEAAAVEGEGALADGKQDGVVEFLHQHGDAECDEAEDASDNQPASCHGGTEEDTKGQ